jgi:hypothetical protein
MREFKISCHAISKIMAGTIGITEIQHAKLKELEVREFENYIGKSGVKPLTPNMKEELKTLIQKRDNPELPQGAKTFLKTWVKEKMFNRKQDWKSIVVDKGLACEPQGIELIGRVHGLDGLSKNDEFFENDYMHGFPDLVHKKVRDVKCSWDLFSFPMFDDQMPNEDYWWQLQGYMILTGLHVAALDYVLIDTPLPLIQLDLKKLFYQSGGKPEDWNPEAHQEMLPNYQFNDIPEKMRVKTFEVEYDPTAAGKIKERVLLSREYIKSIVTEEEIQAA